MGTEDDRDRLARIEERVQRLSALARTIAAELSSSRTVHQEHAALKAGILPRQYYRYLAGDDEPCQAFQAIVLPAIHAQAERNVEEAEGAIGSAENGSGAWAGWHKWLLEKRYRKIYGDLAQEVKLELTGANGGPIQTLAVDKLSDAELDAKIAAAAKLGGGDGE